MPGPELQLFVKSAKGQIWGPLSPATIGLMVENGLIEARGTTLSVDGVSYMEPTRFPPNIRDLLPPELGGGPTLAAAPVAPVAAPNAAARPGAGPTGAAMAGPGATSSAAARTTSAHTAATSAATQPMAPSGGPAAVASRSAPAQATPAPSAPAAPIVSPTSAAATGGVIPPGGELARISPIHLYYLAASGELTGLFTFKLADRSIEVHFRKGSPEYVASSHPEDSVAGFLLQQSLVKPDQIAQADLAKDKFGGDLVGALFGLGILNPTTAFAQLAQRAMGLLLKVLVVESGTFTWELKELPAHKTLPLGNKWAVLSELTRKIPVSELKRRLAPAWDKPVMKSGGRVQPAELRLTPQETRALAYIDGVRSLAQLSVDLPQEADQVVRLAFLLRELEAVSFGAESIPPRPPPHAAKPAAGGEAPTPPVAPATAPPSAAATAGAPRPGTSPTPPPIRPAGPPPAAAPGVPPRPPVTPVAAARPNPAPGPAAGAPRPGTSPAAPARPPVAPAAPAAPRSAAPVAPAAAAAPANFEEELKELRAKAEEMKKQTLFEVLGLPQNTDAGAVKIAYFKMAKLYHPDTVQQNAPPEIGKLKADIFAKVGDAYRRLTDDKSRAEYIEELKSGGDGEGVDVQQILMAEELFQKGSIMVKAKKFADAVKMLDDAIKANPDEGEFYAWRGFAKFFATADKKVGKGEADKDLQLAIKKNDRCAQAYYFIGQIAKLSGDNATAFKNFQKTIELRPDHVDALREVRMAPTKK